MCSMSARLNASRSVIASRMARLSQRERPCRDEIDHSGKHHSPVELWKWPTPDALCPIGPVRLGVHQGREERARSLQYPPEDWISRVFNQTREYAEGLGVDHGWRVKPSAARPPVHGVHVVGDERQQLGKWNGALAGRDVTHFDPVRWLSCRSSEPSRGEIRRNQIDPRT